MSDLSGAVELKVDPPHSRPPSAFTSGWSLACYDRRHMSTRAQFLGFRSVPADILALVASLALAGCGRQSGGDDRVTGNIDAATEAGASTGGGSCTGYFRSWRYETAGCGASAPARVCGEAFDAGCLSGYICTCAGKWEAACARVSLEPWAYLIPSGGQEPPPGGPCDPTVVPAGAIR
jgi:hypothetical protein